MEKDEILRRPRPLIEDRIDLRHRIMDALIDSGMKLQHGHLAKSIDKIDEIVWVDGDMRTTRLRYDLFTTFRRKGIDFDEKDAVAIFESTAASLLARGTGLDFDGLGPNDIDLRRDDRIVEAIELQTKFNARLVDLLEHLPRSGAMSLVPPAEESADPRMPAATGAAGRALTRAAGNANQKIEQPSKPGTPGGKGKPKP